MIDIIVQGGMWPGTKETVKQYARHPLVNRVVLSTWEGSSVIPAEDWDYEEFSPDQIILLKNKKPDYDGPGNLNLHLLSSRNGLANCEKDIVLKIRSDERMSDAGITTWVDFITQQSDQATLSYLDGRLQKNKIGVIATNINYPYHPQDHVFIGHRTDLKRLFDMPFSYEPPIGPEPVDFSTKLRNPIYIGANYFSLFYAEAKSHLDDWKEYLLDEAPKRHEAMAFYMAHRVSIFQPLPRIQMR